MRRAILLEVGPNSNSRVSLERSLERDLIYDRSHYVAAFSQSRPEGRSNKKYRGP